MFSLFVQAPPGRDAILDNDVVAGKSFLDQKTASSHVPQPLKKAATTGGSSSSSSSNSIDIAGMFFENVPATAPASAKKNAVEQEVKLFDDKPIARAESVNDVEFEGPKVVAKPVSSPAKNVVETYQAGEELGESVKQKKNQKKKKQKTKNPSLICVTGFL